MRRLAALLIVFGLALHPANAVAMSSWGSPEYGDPPGWCTKFSDMWVATVQTNDPLVGTNPEQDTFYGFHRNPGYDDWYGFFYGDFRGRPGDSSGWINLLHETYPHHYHWNFADNGWAVHGHVKEYIAYYNWTFGGQCGLGGHAGVSPPPFMADQYGYPVVDIYVDAVPPFAPQPYVSGVAAGSVAFTWDPVADRGDGVGQDYFVSGMDHYVSWLTLNGAPHRLQPGSTAAPRTLTLTGMGPQDTACVHVQAVDRVGNATAEQVACAAPLPPPPMPAWAPLKSAVAANPVAPGLVGLDSWLWLTPAPAAITVGESYRGVDYAVTATPVAADWDFGDGAAAHYQGASGFGAAYPQPPSVTHLYEAHSQAGYLVHASVRYAVSWTAIVGGRSFGPYPLGAVMLAAQPLTYPVEQAQPELIEI
ncbi:hypothetical protein EPN29_09145 [bacterium]|nr:MAG: hypothetical protein EPN29_09145 [bacterium]